MSIIVPCRCLKATVGIFSMVSEPLVSAHIGRCLSSWMISLLCVALFPAHFSDISGLATTQCYHIISVHLGHAATVNIMLKGSSHET